MGYTEAEYYRIKRIKLKTSMIHWARVLELKSDFTLTPFYQSAVNAILNTKNLIQKIFFLNVVLSTINRIGID